MRRLVVLSLCLCFAVPVAARGFEVVSDSLYGDTVVVTASRVPGPRLQEPLSIDITGKTDIQSRPVATTADALREESGISVQKTTQGHGSPILRGLIGNYVLLLYDGIRLNNSTFRFGPNQYLNVIDFESLGRIETVMGPSSVLYGSDAMGGTINLIPKSAAGLDPGLQIDQFSARYSSADRGKLLSGSVTAGSDRWQLLAGGSYKSFDDLRAGGDIGFQRPTGWNEYGLTLRTSVLPNRNARIGLDYVGVRQDEVPRYDKYADGTRQQFIYDPQDRDLVSLSLEAQAQSPLTDGGKVVIAYQRNDEATLEQRPGSTTLTNTLTQVHTVGGFAQLEKTVGTSHTLVYGLEYYFDRVLASRNLETDSGIYSARPAYPNGSEYQSLGAFARDSWQIGRSMKLVAGLRISLFDLETPLEAPYGSYSDRFSDVTGSLGLTYRLAESRRVYANWSRGFRAPNLDDVTVLQSTNQGVDAPSPGLVPESGNYLEIGFKQIRDHLQLSTSVYYNQLSNLIDRRPGFYQGLSFVDENGNGVQDSGEPDVYQKANVGSAKIFGADLSVTKRFMTHWEGRVNAQYTWGENQENKEPMSRIPPASGLLALRWYPRSQGWLEVVAQAAGAQERLSSADKSDTRIGPDGTPGWVVFGLRCEWRWAPVTVGVILENVLDAAYKTHGSGVYAPGHNVMLRLTYE